MKLTIEGTPDEIKKALQAVQSEERESKTQDGFLVFRFDDGLYFVKQGETDKLIYSV